MTVRPRARSVEPRALFGSKHCVRICVSPATDRRALHPPREVHVRVSFSIRMLAVAAGAILASVFPASSAVGQSADASRPRTLDVGGMDTSAAACTDFYQYADGKWLASNPIPSDRPRWGPSDELRLRNQNDLREILEKLAADKSAPKGSDERKLGDFYGSCMDETGIEKAGIGPIQPELARIDAIRDVPTLR